MTRSPDPTHTRSFCKAQAATLRAFAAGAAARWGARAVAERLCVARTGAYAGANPVRILSTVAAALTFLADRGLADRRLEVSTLGRQHYTYQITEAGALAARRLEERKSR